MAGERYSKLTIRAAWSFVAQTRGDQTTEVRFKLGGQWETYRRGGGSTDFVVPDPNDLTPPRSFVLEGVKNLLALVRATIARRGLPYVVSEPRDAGDDASHLNNNGTFTSEVAPWPIVEFDITAKVYERDYNLDFSAVSASGWQVVQNLPAIEPILVTASVIDAVVYKSATGSINIKAFRSNTNQFFYKWADSSVAISGYRPNLVGPATYTVVVTDGSGASTSLDVVVGSDPRLDVAVQKIDNNVTLLVTGGVGPYTYAWSDGAATAVRKALPAGTYECTVTDSHGASVTVKVEIDFFNRFYFSRNPVVLDLATTDLTDKPNLHFLLEVWLEEEYLSGVFVNIAGVLNQPADQDGRTSFDVSTLLDAYVRPDFPIYGQYGVQLAPACFKRFYLQHSEQWDGSPTPTYTVRETHYLVYGGLDFFEYASQSYFTVVRPQVHPFLSWEPVQKEVLADQPEYLYYQHDSLTDDVFTVQVTLLDSQDRRTAVPLGTATGVQCFSIWRLGVGLQQLRTVLGAAVPADVLAWEVQVLDSTGTTVSETRYFQLSDELPANRRYFLYANSVAGINTLACRGKGKQELTVSSTLVQRSLRAGYDPDAGETFTTSAAGVPTLTCNTGYLDPARLEALQDFLLSEEIRYYDTDRYRPGSLQPVEALPLADDAAGLLSVEFAFVLPTQRRYTPTLPRK